MKGVGLLISARELEARRAAASGPLAPLADSLRADLHPIVTSHPAMPAAKALLSRDGGRCPRDGSVLAFDPYAPREHRCPLCGDTFGGDRHDRWWVTWYQLWLAERAVHGAALHATRGDPDAAALSRHILGEAADRYLNYPNRDNVLGPTRPFFSTYLESIWLLQIAISVDLLELSDADEGIGGVVRDRVVEPSAALIGSFDEGSSNRQVWNAAALLASALLLGLRADALRAVAGRSGVISHLQHGLLSDGTWYEGENYHLFAHRGLWYGVTMAERAGLELPALLRARYQCGFAIPLITALPDMTFPARRDSHYAVSLRQWRFAESFELGLAREHDPILLGGLRALYDGSLPRIDAGRWRSTAEAERNELATSLTRSDLGWRSLLHALPELPPTRVERPRSVLLAEQGLAIFRRNRGEVYVALDYGHHGGGHGHPDRLNVMLSHGRVRWLDDYGTGSYVERSLHWYRSTLAHNAPLADGASQRRANGVLRAHDERGGVGWVEAELRHGVLARGVRATRSLVVMPEYVVDELRWDSTRDATLDLPIHAPISAAARTWFEAPMPGGDAPEDGFGFVSDTWMSHLDEREVVRLMCRGDELAGGSSETPAAFLAVTDAAELWTATAAGPPGQGQREFHMVRMFGTSGSVTTVWNWSGGVRDVTLEGEELHVALAGGTRHVHGRWEGGWRVDLFAGEARSSVDLGGRVPIARDDEAVELTPVMPARTLVVPRTPGAYERGLVLELGAGSWRRSEQSWEDAGRPRATIRLLARDHEFAIEVLVLKSPLVFRPADAPDPALDNEHPDIHSDGLQLYVQGAGWDTPAGWLVVPEAGGRTRSRVVDGYSSRVALESSWRPVAGGYAIDLALPLADLGVERPFAFGLMVNEMGPGRERRRGQLALSGGGGYVYLRGDRHDPSSLLHLVVPGA